MSAAATVIENLEWIESRVGKVKPYEKVGRVLQVTGLVVESEGPEVPLGDIIEIHVPEKAEKIAAQVVGFRDNRVLLMPFSELVDIHSGCKVVAGQGASLFPVGSGLVGRVIDGLGKPIDGKGPIRAEYRKDLYGEPLNPMMRGKIERAFETGVKAIDTFVPMGVGQRMGVFAGSGVGKSSLMGMIARGGEAEVNVIALVGERGRELREFIESDLGEEGLKKSVIVVSTSEQSAALRIRAALLATRIAEYFRDEGKQVMFLMDSLTRLAMAQREIGLSVGEPPASRGYTPSVFSLLSKVVERSGMGAKGAITALYTVLVEGDDMNEIIADTVRGLLDGHIVLRRELAVANHYPAIDVLDSISRLTRQICNAEELMVIGELRDMMATYRKNEDLINVGAYVKGASAKIDRAIGVNEKAMAFLRQGMDEWVGRKRSYEMIREVMV